MKSCVQIAQRRIVVITITSCHWSSSIKLLISFAGNSRVQMFTALASHREITNDGRIGPQCARLQPWR